MTSAPSTGLGTHRDPRAERRSLGVLLFLAGLLFVLRWSGPSNLTDNDQERPASYILDVVVNGQWLVQRDWTGDITSKPPLYTWLSALASLVAGRVTLLTLYLPCTLAIAGTAWLAASEVTRLFGWRSGLLAGWFVLVNPLSAKLVALARTDAVFTFTVSLTAVLVFRAWSTKSSQWMLPWLAAAAATLTKGPFGIWLGFCGLAAARGGGERRPAVLHAGPHAKGILLLLLVCGGWFGLAYLGAGDALVNKMLKAELVQHAVRREDTVPGLGLVLAPAYFLSRFAPWSLLAIIAALGVIRGWRMADVTDGVRLKRFCAAWLVGGCLVLGLASHQRGDLVAPLVLPCAVLAASLATRWLDRLSPANYLGALTATGVVAAIGIQAQHQGRIREAFLTSEGCRQLAHDFRSAGGDPRRLIHVDTPFALQFHLQTMNRARSFREAAQDLAQDPTRWAAVTDRAALAQAWPDGAPDLHVIARWPTNSTPARFEIVGVRSAPPPHP